MTGTQLNMAAGIREFGQAAPKRVAVIDGDSTLTFGQLDERSSRFANALLNRGVHPGEPFAILSNNRAEFFEIAAGLAKAGVVGVPLNTKNATIDNEYILDHCGARGIVMETDLQANVEGLVSELDVVVSIPGGSGSVTEAGEDYESVLASARPVDPGVVINELDPFCITYTSGTTGRPKGVKLTHRGRVLTAYAVGLEYGLGPNTSTVAVAPMYHGAGFAFAYAGPFLGGSTSVLRSWDPERCLHVLQQDRANSVFLVPTHAQHIRRITEEPCRTFNLEHLHTLYFNAAALPVALKEWVVEAFPHAGIHELYGSTECSVVTNLRPEFASSKAGSVGHPWFMNEVRLADDDGAEVDPGEPGELFARSPMLLGGYLHDDEATADGYDENGFFSVGDIAVRDEEGFISIVDRKKDIIISGGVNIFPREIEEVIAHHAPVEDVAVVGVPDEAYGERIAAFVVSRPGADLDIELLRTYVGQHVAKYKMPRWEWHVRDVLPRNSSGKVLKRQIRDDYIDGTS